MTAQTTMLEHAAARRLAASALDGPLDPADGAALQAHLDGCPACRTVATALRRDADLLHDLDLGPVPVAVRAEVAIAAERRGRGGSIGRWGVIVVVGAILIAGIGGGVIGGGGRQPASPGATALALDPANQITWKTDVALLSAKTFSIQAGDRTFTGRTPDVQVTSDPGDARRRTLETTWTENGVEMRLNLYFSGDDQTWWVSEIRTRDGRPASKTEWIAATGQFFRSPIGQAWTGDLDVVLKGDAVPVTGSLHLVGATVATKAVDLVTEPFGGGKAVAQGARPFGPGGELRCSGILQMSPHDAETALLSLGYRLSWRREVTTGPNAGNAEPMPHAPDGVIIGEPVPGSSGELIVFVAPFGDPKATPLVFPADCPASDPNRPPPAPSATP